MSILAEKEKCLFCGNYKENCPDFCQQWQQDFIDAIMPILNILADILKWNEDIDRIIIECYNKTK